MCSHMQLLLLGVRTDLLLSLPSFTLVLGGALAGSVPANTPTAMVAQQGNWGRVCTHVSNCSRVDRVHAHMHADKEGKARCTNLNTW